MRNPWLSKKFKIYSHKITTPLVLYHDSDWHVGPESNLNRMSFMFILFFFINYLCVFYTSQKCKKQINPLLS